jgi:hypothetical protein
MNTDKHGFSQIEEGWNLDVEFPIGEFVPPFQGLEIFEL